MLPIGSNVCFVTSFVDPCWACVIILCAEDMEEERGDSDFDCTQILL